MRHATLRAGLSAAVLLALGACSAEGPAESRATVSSGDPAACPGEVLDVVVSVGAWSDVVRQLGGDCATVTTLAPSGAASHALAPEDRESIADADLVVVNGARYDRWATDAVEASAGDPSLVSAAAVAGERAARDPHLWNDPAAVPVVAEAVARELAGLSSDAAPYFDAQHTTWLAELQPWLDAVTAVRAQSDGRTVAATAPGFGRMVATVGLTDVTPVGYLRSIRSGEEPSAADVDEFATSLRAGAVDVLVQVDDAVPDELRDAADDADIPIVEVTASPAADAPFVERQLAQLASLAEALAAGR